MSRVCEYTGRKTGVGNTRSHSLRAHKRKYYPNLFYRNIKDPATGVVIRIKVSAAGLRTMKKRWII